LGNVFEILKMLKSETAEKLKKMGIKYIAGVDNYHTLAFQCQTHLIGAENNPVGQLIFGNITLAISQSVKDALDSPDPEQTLAELLIELTKKDK
jgi:hypothetical protein